MDNFYFNTVRDYVTGEKELELSQNEDIIKHAKAMYVGTQLCVDISVGQYFLQLTAGQSDISYKIPELCFQKKDDLAFRSLFGIFNEISLAYAEEECNGIDITKFPSLFLKIDFNQSNVDWVFTVGNVRGKQGFISWDELKKPETIDWFCAFLSLVDMTYEYLPIIARSFGRTDKIYGRFDQKF